MIGQHIPTLLLTVVAISFNTGCRTHQNEPLKINTNIGYMDGKYKVCRDNCPQATLKVLDDSVPEDILESRLLENPKPTLAVQPTAFVLPNPQPAHIDVPENSVITAGTQFKIYFNFGMSKPNIQGRKELLRFVKQTQKFDNIEIELVGKTDDIGTQKFNRSLAYKRAKYVKSWLRSKGVGAHIMTSDKEECCRARPTNKRELGLKAKRSVLINSYRIEKERAMSK